MSALWGARVLRAKALLLVLLLPLAACEYSPDEPARAEPAATPSANQALFLADLMHQLAGPPPAAGLPYATGRTADWTGELPAGDYLLTTACSGASRLEVKMVRGEALPEAWDYPCGERRESFLRHSGGALMVRVTALYGLEDGVAGMKIEPNADQSLRENFEASAWAEAVLGPSIPGEIRGSASSTAPTSFGLSAPPGHYELDFACRGTSSVRLSIQSWNGSEALAEEAVPCGETLNTELWLPSEGADLRMAPAGGDGQYSFRLLPKDR